MRFIAETNGIEIRIDTHLLHLVRYELYLLNILILLNDVTARLKVQLVLLMIRAFQMRPLWMTMLVHSQCQCAIEQVWSICVINYFHRTRTALFRQVT